MAEIQDPGRFSPSDVNSKQRMDRRGPSMLKSRNYYYSCLYNPLERINRILPGYPMINFFLPAQSEVNYYVPLLARRPTRR